MKKFYTSENLFLTHNVKNLVEAQGIKVFLRNEFTQGAMGEVAVFDTWPELWVEDAHYDRAMTLVDQLIASDHSADWVCPYCSELNAPSFDLCWNCQGEPAE